MAPVWKSLEETVAMAPVTSCLFTVWYPMITTSFRAVVEDSRVIDSGVVGTAETSVVVKPTEVRTRVVVDERMDR